jgi:hypothetical protein
LPIEYILFRLKQTKELRKDIVNERPQLVKEKLRRLKKQLRRRKKQKRKKELPRKLSTKRKWNKN